MLTTLHAFFSGADALVAAQELKAQTMKRPNGSYAAQVRSARGIWQVGVFAQRADAKRAARTFLATGPVEPEPGTPRADLPANWRWTRSDSHAPRHKWVRKVKGLNTWQARVWLGTEHGSLNLGLFTFTDHGDQAEWAAAQVAKAFGREWKPGRTIGEVVELLKASPKRNERCPAALVVPERQRGLYPPQSYGPMSSASERREEEREQRVTLADYFAAV